MKASKSKLTDNDMWDPLVIGSNISLPSLGQTFPLIEERPLSPEGMAARPNGGGQRWREGAR